MTGTNLHPSMPRDTFIRHVCSCILTLVDITFFHNAVLFIVFLKNEIQWDLCWSCVLTFKGISTQIDLHLHFLLLLQDFLHFLQFKCIAHVFSPMLWLLIYFLYKASVNIVNILSEYTWVCFDCCYNFPFSRKFPFIFHINWVIGNLGNLPISNQLQNHCCVKPAQVSLDIFYT